MIKILKITYRFFILQLKIRKYTLKNDDISFEIEGVEALNELIERSSRL